jgi:hypothetical protein
MGRGFFMYQFIFMNVLKGFQRDCVPLAETRGSASGRCSQFSENSEPIQRRLAMGELKNSPVDCFSRGNALQEKAFPDNNNQKYIFQKSRKNMRFFCVLIRFLQFAPEKIKTDSFPLAISTVL